MTIGIITESLNAGISGIGNYTLNLCRHLLSLSKNLNVVSFNYQTLDILPPRVEQRIIKNPFKHLLKTHFWYPYLIRKNVFNDIDVLHNPAQIPTFFTPPVPYVITIHDLSPLILPDTHKAGKNFIYRKLLPRTLKKAQKIIAVSRDTENSLARLYPEIKNKTQVIYEALDENFFNSQASGDQVAKIRVKYNLPKKFILAVGSLSPRKNYVRLIEALPIIRKSAAAKDCQLVIVGNFAWKYGEIYRTVLLRKLEREVHIFNGVTNEELPAFYKLARALVFPSLLEGFGLPILEAFACGCPVIASNNSALSEIAAGAALLIDPRSAFDIAAKAVKIISDPTVKNNFVAKGKRRLNDFSWQKSAFETYKLYENIISQ